MRVLRVLRGVIGTAATFAVSWGIFGAALLIAKELIWPRTHPEITGSVYLWLGLKGAGLFGALGAAVGATFAGALAASGRRLAFEQLSAGRVLRLGVAGGVVVSGAVLGTIAMLTAAWPTHFSVEVGISALLGGASSWAMLQIARRSRPSASGALDSGDGREFEPALARERAEAPQPNVR
jgi:hypothetical protein